MIKKIPPLRFRLENERKRLNVPWNILEQDYVLSWVLMGISSIPELKQSLAFKGGTALKKCYFGEYRFSEDLDFSYTGAQITGDLIEEHLKQACNVAIESIAEYMPPPILTVERYTEKQPHPEGQLAYIIRAQLPWHKEPMVKVMVEVTMMESIELPLVTKNIIHNYGEDISASLNVYSLEEIVVEKLRAILQYTKKLHEQGWARSRVRDYYDLWNIFKNFGSQINYQIIGRTLEIKCKNKAVSFASQEDFFQPITLADAKKGWDEWLKPLIISLPDYDDVILSLRKEIGNVMFIKSLSADVIKRYRQGLSSSLGDYSFNFRDKGEELYGEIVNLFSDNPGIRFYRQGLPPKAITDVDKIITYLELNR